MARRAVTVRRERAGGRRLVLVVMIAVTAVIGLVAAPAHAQQATSRVTLAATMTGEAGGVRTAAASSWDDVGATITLRITNPTTETTAVEIPYGVMFAAADESQQTIVTAGVRSSEAAASADPSTPVTVSAPPGESTVGLVAFCGQHLDHSPPYSVPVNYKGVAQAPLPTVLHNIDVQKPDEQVAQDAVWWVTDEPTLPIADPDVASLLQGVDTATFAAAPTKVVPEDSYTPKWAGGTSGALGPFGGRGVAGSSPLVSALLLLVLMALAVGVTIIIGRRQLSRTKVRATVRNDLVPGWYQDPRGPELRYWDGRVWTEHRRGW